jgi:hypothetical protein
MASRVALLAVVAACGGGKSRAIDAADAIIDVRPPDVSIAPDGAPDAPPATTAIGITGVAAFTATSGQVTKIPYGGVAYDDAGEFAASTSTFVAKHAGDYFLCASLDVGSPTAKFQLAVYVNGSERLLLDVANGVASGCSALRLRAGDSVDLRAYPYASNPNLSVPADAYHSWLTIEAQPITAFVNTETANEISMPDHTFVKIPYSMVVFDDASQIDTNNTEFVAATAGDYQVCASLFLGLPGELDVFVDGARRQTFGGGFHGCRSVRAAAGARISIWAMQTSGNTIAILPNAPPYPWLSIQPQPATVSIDGVTAFATTAQTFATVPYASEEFDDQSQFDTAASTFTAKAAGDYRLCASLTIGSAPTGGNSAELDAYTGGARDKALRVTTTDSGLGGCRVVRLGALEQLQLEFEASTDTSLANDGYWDWLDIAKLK